MIIKDLALDFSDVLIIPKRSELSSRKNVSLIRKFDTRNDSLFEGVPIIASNMATGNFTMLSALAQNKMFTAIAKHHSNEWFEESNLNERLQYGFYTIGMNKDEFQQLEKYGKWLKDRHENIDGIDIFNYLKICIDIANGYSESFADFVNNVRKSFRKNVIIAGNVCTPEMTQELILAGADFVKIGIGPGSECETRLKTGVGYPQLSACIDCSDVAHGLDAGIILDGGMTCPGDIAKSFCANADMVMIGGLFAGTDECDGEILTKYINNGEYQLNKFKEIHPVYEPVIIEKKYKLFYGMSSKYAQDTHGNGYKDYRASEGKEELIEYKGPVQNVINDILGGLRSCGTYIGANKIRNFGKCGSFVRVSKIHSRF
jgi:GMP reductase